MNTDQIFGNRLVAYQYAYERRFIRPLEPDEEPPRGAHLVAPWRGFSHHGVYVGEGKIIHYNAMVYELRRRPIEETSMAGFSEGRPVFVVNHADSVDEAEEVVRRARSRLGENRYHLLKNNCEHFVEWCLHGVERSFQVESALDFPRRAASWWRANLLQFISRLIRAAAPRRADDCDAPVRRTPPETVAD